MRISSLIVEKDAPALHKKAEPINFDDPADVALAMKVAGEMVKAFADSDAVGLAAPQLGYSLRIIIVGQFLMINPLWGIAKGNRQRSIEGCLSIPGKMYTVERFPWVSVTYQDQYGKTRFAKFDGLAARVVQHELDHLNGVLISRGTEETSGKAEV